MAIPYRLNFSDIAQYYLSPFTVFMILYVCCVRGSHDMHIHTLHAHFSRDVIAKVNNAETIITFLEYLTKCQAK